MKFRQQNKNENEVRKRMNNPIKPVPCKIINVNRESVSECTFRVETDMIPTAHGQFFQISIPKIGEAPISISAYGDNWVDFTIRSVGKVTDVVFEKKPGDHLFLRGPYGHGWPVDHFKGKNLVVVTGGTGLAPVRSMLTLIKNNPGYCESVTLISGFKDEKGIVFKPELDEWKSVFNTTYTLDRDQIDGWKVGFVTEHIKDVPFKDFGDNYELVIVGPPPMMKFTAKAANEIGVPDEKIWVSFERKMSCGIGKCGHCRIDEVYVCLDGPVFNYTEAKNLID